jgi:hypothetical protein
MFILCIKLKKIVTSNGHRSRGYII